MVILSAKLAINCGGSFDGIKHFICFEEPSVSPQTLVNILTIGRPINPPVFVSPHRRSKEDSSLNRSIGKLNPVSTVRATFQLKYGIHPPSTGSNITPRCALRRNHCTRIPGEQIFGGVDELGWNSARPRYETTETRTLASHGYSTAELGCTRRKDIVHWRNRWRYTKV